MATHNLWPSLIICYASCELCCCLSVSQVNILGSPSMCSCMLTTVYCRVCVCLFQCPATLAATHNHRQVFSMFYMPCELCFSCSVPQLNSGVTRYLQWYIDSSFLQGERIMCVESPGVTRYLQWYIDSRFLQGERIMCVESPGVCSGTLTAVFCRVRGLCVWLFHYPVTLAATQSLAGPHHVLHAV